MELNLRQMYLDIVRKTILGLTYRDPSLDASKGQQIPFNRQARELGEDWPVLAHSMAGNRRLLNIQQLAEDVINKNIPGDFIETGVWRGGACIFMNAVLRAYGITDRNVYVCDSFQGLPPPNVHGYPQDLGDTHHTAPFLAVTLEQVQANFEGYDLLDDRVKFVKGWFSDTLPTLAVEKLAILRLDGDMYESTIIALENLYPKLSVSGYVIVDDYGLPNCRRALADYREFHGIDSEYITIDNSSVYWIKTKEVDADKIDHKFKNTAPMPEVTMPVYSAPNRGGSISSVF
jgi:O-methyltransferase